MKHKTWVLLANALKEGSLYFPEDKCHCEISLTKTEIWRIINTEFGYTSKSSRRLKKHMKVILNNMLKEVIKIIQQGDYNVKKENIEDGNNGSENREKDSGYGLSDSSIENSDVDRSSTEIS